MLALYAAFVHSLAQHGTQNYSKRTLDVTVTAKSCIEVGYASVVGQTALRRQYLLPGLLYRIPTVKNE